LAAPKGDLGLFLGYNAKSSSNELGNAIQPDEVVQGALGGGVRGSLALIGPLAAELELKYLRSELLKSQHSAVIFAPRASLLYEFRPDAQLRPFVKVTGGMEILQSYSPRLPDEVDSEFLVGLGAGARYDLSSRWGVRLDLLAAMTPGRNQELVPEAEFWLGGYWRFGTGPADADADGVADVADKCPQQHEDQDGFEDSDGCPDPDNDGDGVADGADRCPQQAEDKDGFEDSDGCPDADDDKDGLADAQDRCPRQAEDKDGFEDGDGCPDPDNDKDGVADTADRCPLQLGSAEDAGCPPKDSDGDGIVDKLDKCPDKKETFNGKDDGDGCPDGAETVVVSERSIEIRERVFFGLGNATIEAASFPLLNTVATALSSYPRLTKVAVEGHTDDVGDPAANQVLSNDRAAAVATYLESKGIARSRLQAVGFGSSRPLCLEIAALQAAAKPNKTKLERCRDKNRRVQFQVLEMDGAPIPSSAPAGAAAPPASPAPPR
jgi:outer membrane protein OmpA-like peptidoglycan-associated protein